jgi:hypothetical protein
MMTNTKKYNSNTSRFEIASYPFINYEGAGSDLNPILGPRVYRSTTQEIFACKPRSYPSGVPVSPFINASFKIRNERGWIADLRKKSRWKIKVLSYILLFFQICSQ